MTRNIKAPKPTLQWAKACRPTRGEDRVFTFPLAGRRALLVGVADGVSSANGRYAAEWIEQTMRDVANTAKGRVLGARKLFRIVSDALVVSDVLPITETMDSLSTLSCGICRLRDDDGSPILRFEFFAVGDSPIWRFTRLVPPREPSFQASVVYDSPTPREQGLVYSFVSLLNRRIEGRPHFGAVELAEGEMLLVASDGVPEWRIFGEDQDPKYSSDSPKLIDRLLSAESITDELLEKALLEYDRRGMLIDDDASIAVVRWAYQRQTPIEPETELSAAEPEMTSAAVEAKTASATKATPRPIRR
jgi:hypothetical protein